MEIINLTPHDITILNEEKEIVQVVPQSGKFARLCSEKESISRWDICQSNIQFFITRYGAPNLLDENGEEYRFPEYETGTIYIVSGPFRSGYNRSDLWQPGELVRDEHGNPIGCIGLSQ